LTDHNAVHVNKFVIVLTEPLVVSAVVSTALGEHDAKGNKHVLVVANKGVLAVFEEKLQLFLSNFADSVAVLVVQFLNCEKILLAHWFEPGFEICGLLLCLLLLFFNLLLNRRVPAN
jgi:hypothetical protein